MKIHLHACFSLLLVLVVIAPVGQSVPVGVTPVRSPGVFLPVPTEDEMSLAADDIRRQTFSLINNRDFVGLDALARDLRADQVEFANGSRRLSYFYSNLGALEKGASEVDWQNRIRFLRRWFEEDPDSITARVALALAEVRYGWFARGGGWAKTVSPEAWSLVGERVAEAGRILEAARNLPEKCPYWHNTWQIRAVLAEEPNDRYEEGFAEAIRDYPDFTSFYLTKAWRLQTRWYGREGEWQAFAQGAADQAGGEAGDILYARIVWYVRELHYYNNPITETGIDWPRTERGFEAILRRYPDSLLALSEYCSLARFAPDGSAPLLRKLFEKIGNRVDLKIWDSTAQFMKVRDRAYSQ